MKSMDKIWNLDLLHEYYKDGRSKDFTIEPASSTLYSLAGLNWFVKPYQDAISILAPEIESQLKIPLQFNLTLKNTDFFHFTDIPETNGYIHWYELHTNKVEHRQIRLFGSLFTYNFESESSQLQLTLEDNLGSIVSRVTSNSNNKNHEFGIDLSGYPSGLYTLKVTGGKKQLHQEKVCIDDELVSANAFGVLRLLPQKLKAGKTHQIKFKSKKESWKFYFISSTESEEAFILKDESKGNGENRYTSTPFTFSERPVVEEIDGEQVICFETGTVDDNDKFTPQLIPAYEESKKNLTLYRYNCVEYQPKDYKKEVYRKYRYSKYNKQRRQKDDDDDYHNDFEYFIHTCIEKSIWDRRLKCHLILKGKRIYRKYRLRKRGTKVLTNVQNPSVKQMKKEVYIYI